MDPVSQPPRWWRVWRNSGPGRALTRWLGGAPDIPDRLWERVVRAQPFLQRLAPAELACLRDLCQHFLAEKEFTGAQGLEITDAMALTIATQACLPWVHWGRSGLDWYRDFVGIVVHPDEVVAQREVVDDAGVVHRYREALAGEAMHGGPVMLAWSHVAGAREAAGEGRNLVIHEFAHKIDMRHKSRYEAADGCPRLPRGFMQLSAAQADQRWRTTWAHAYEDFLRRVEMAERFGAPLPWLDAYGATDPAEFFAVACEAWAVNRERFAAEFPTLLPLLDAFFRHPPAQVSGATAP